MSKKFNWESKPDGWSHYEWETVKVARNISWQLHCLNGNLEKFHEQRSTLFNTSGDDSGIPHRLNEKMRHILKTTNPKPKKRPGFDPNDPYSDYED